MKQIKRPTRRQKETIRQLGFNPDNWFVERDSVEEFVLIHRETGRKRTFRKGA